MTIRLLIFVFVFSSCSTDWKGIFSGKEDTKKRNEKLMKDFEVKDDVLEKFKEVKTEPIPSDPPERKKLETVPKKKTASRKRVALKKVVVPKKAASKKETSKVNLSYTSEDYPEKFRDFDRVSKKFWKSFSPKVFPGEQAVFAIKYAGITTGNITVESKPDTAIGGTEAYHIKARVKTSSYYSYLYEVDDICDSYIKKENFLPLKFSLIQRQSSQDIDALQLFDHENLKTYSLYKRVAKDKVRKKKKTKDLPLYFQDPLSIVYFIRGLPMTIGAKYEVPIINKAVAEVLEAKIVKKEVINTELGEKEAYQIAVLTNHKGKTLDSGNMTLWYSADEKRIFLGFEAKVKLGAISGKIIKYNSAK